MSWFGGGRKSDKARKKQIASLEAKDGKSYKLYKLGTNHFRVTFRCRTFSDPLAIQIHLNDDFPDSPPKISVDRKYSHQLLDDNGIVTKLDELNKWSPHSDLGLIVQKITNLFNASTPIIKHNFPQQGQPPPPQQPPPQGLPTYNDHIQNSQSQRDSYYGGGGGGGHHALQAQAQSQHAQSMHGYPHSGHSSQNSWQYAQGPGGGGPSGGGPIGSDPGGSMSGGRRPSQHVAEPTSDLSTMKLSPPSVIPGFASKTLSELEELDKEHHLLQDYAYSIASTLREMKHEAQNGCMQTAQQNIAAHEAILKLKEDNEEARANVETLTELYKNLKKREETVLQKFSIPKILAQIDRKLDEIDTKCEALKDQFESADITHVIYTKKLTKLRKAYHLLSIKKEKLQLRHGHFS